jgi:uncharacterized RDD family membrane protein YckC
MLVVPDRFIEVMRGRSLGKRLFGLTVVREDGLPMDAATSFRRNWPLGITVLTALLVFVPVLGWLLIPFVVLAGLVFFVVEVVKVLTDPDGRRYGDLQARTRVVVEQTRDARPAPAPGSRPPADGGGGTMERP